MAKLSPPVPKAKPVPILSDEELAALLKACSGKEFRDHRGEAMIRLLLDCGLRVSSSAASPRTASTSTKGWPGEGQDAEIRPVYFGARAGIPDPHPHRFRHTWAPDYLASDGQERDLVCVNGHTLVGEFPTAEGLEGPADGLPRPGER